jgi:hypothetical protein
MKQGNGAGMVGSSGGGHGVDNINQT